MHIDHIFIFTDIHEEITDELMSFGLTPNDSRIHEGQGTANRTFSFENFFLEIVWVHNEQEIKSDSVKPSGLRQRAEFSANTYSPFGLIIVNDEESDPLFKEAFKYQPDYFPPGMAFDVIQNDVQADLPWTCRMPFKREGNSRRPTVNHKNGMHTLTNAIFEYAGTGGEDFIAQFKNEETMQFKKSDKAWLTLIFDNGRQNKTVNFESLWLTIEY